MTTSIFDANVHEICQHNELGKQTFIPKTENPHDLPVEAICSLTTFCINGFEGPAIVSDIIDGDTVNIIVYVPLAKLANGHQYHYYSKKGIRSFIHTHFMNAGFFTKLKCRLNGCDAMEKDTPEGKFAKELTIDLYKRIKGKVWVEFPQDDDIEDSDKYGRSLIKIYADKTKKVEYNNYLFQFNDEKNGIRVVEPYDGGKKSEYSKNLNKRSEKQTKLMEEKLKSHLETIRANYSELEIENSNKRSFFRKLLCCF